MAVTRARSIVGDKGFLATLPVAGAALMPKIVCAACWPAYTAALATVGIEFVDCTPYLLPLTGLGVWWLRLAPYPSCSGSPRQSP